METRSPLPGGIILDGSYEVVRVIGMGGFGITYEAMDHGLGRPVALKEYYPADLGIRETEMSVRPRSGQHRELFERLRSSFLREARTLSQFNHPAIVRVLRVFEAHGTAYMVMDLEKGGTLKERLATLGRAPRQSELDLLARPLLSALATIHAGRFLHRDIAPDNIIIREDGSPVLLDFGATRRVMAELTSDFTGLVKRGYSPMEQYAMDASAQGAWTDIYAFGACLYRCVTGREPQEATMRVLQDLTPPAAEHALGQYRPHFLRAIDHALAVRPDDRPRTIQALEEELFAEAEAADVPPARQSRGSAAATVGLVSNFAPEKPSAQEAHEIPAEARRWLRRWTAIGIGVAALGMIVLGYELGRTGFLRLVQSGPDTRPLAVASAPEVVARSVAPAGADEKREEAARREIDRERARLDADRKSAREKEEAIRAAEARQKEEKARREAELDRLIREQLARGGGPKNPPPALLPPVARLAACDGITAPVGNDRKCIKAGDVFRDCPECPEMVVIPAGEFTMGAPAGEVGGTLAERPLHKVTFGKPFAVSRYEVTRGEFKRYVSEDKRPVEKGCLRYTGPAGERKYEDAASFEAPGYTQETDRHPVVCVSWATAVEYSGYLSKQTGRPYRLPSEAEWEYAARAGSSERYFFGSDDKELCRYANIATTEHAAQLSGRPLLDCVDKAARTAPVGSYAANKFGLYDVIGNVWEWVADCSHDDYFNAPSDGSARRTDLCLFRVARGGSWGSTASNARMANRWIGHQATSRVFHIGFRVARSLD